MATLNQKLRAHHRGRGLCPFSPPLIPGIGAGREGDLLTRRPRGQGHRLPGLRTPQKFVRRCPPKRPSWRASPPRFVPWSSRYQWTWTRDKVLKQGVPLKDVYQTLVLHMGGIFREYFNRLADSGRSTCRRRVITATRGRRHGQFSCATAKAAWCRSRLSPASTNGGAGIPMRYNLYRSAQVNPPPNRLQLRPGP